MSEQSTEGRAQHPTDDPAARPPLDAGRLRGAGLPDGLRLEVVEASGSTNADVAARAASGEAAGLVLLTEHQTAGRGRLDRVWTTPPRACLTFSLLLRPRAVPARWPWLPLLTGYAVAQALRPHAPTVGLKWPNDVLLGDRKVAGILVERHETPQGAVAVVGIGLNVTLAPDELPVPTATSLAIALGGPGGPVPDRTDLFGDLLGELQAAFSTWDVPPAGAGADASAAVDERLRTAYAQACTTLGRRVRVELPSRGPLVGRATAVDAEGRLVVEVADPEGSGPPRAVAVGAGDVVHVRGEA